MARPVCAANGDGTSASLCKELGQFLRLYPTARRGWTSVFRGQRSAFSRPRRCTSARARRHGQHRGSRGNGLGDSRAASRNPVERCPFGRLSTARGVAHRSRRERRPGTRRIQHRSRSAPSRTMVGRGAALQGVRGYDSSRCNGCRGSGPVTRRGPDPRCGDYELALNVGRRVLSFAILFPKLRSC